MPPAQVIPFPGGQEKPPGEVRVKELAVRDCGVRMTKHSLDRMKERDISMRQVLNVLQKGHADCPAKKDKHGSWKIKMRRTVSGRSVEIVVAIYKSILVVITVI